MSGGTCFCDDKWLPASDLESLWGPFLRPFARRKGKGRRKISLRKTAYLQSSATTALSITRPISPWLPAVHMCFQSIVRVDPLGSKNVRAEHAINSPHSALRPSLQWLCACIPGGPRAIHCAFSVTARPQNFLDTGVMFFLHTLCRDPWTASDHLLVPQSPCTGFHLILTSFQSHLAAMHVLVDARALLPPFLPNRHLRTRGGASVRAAAVMIGDRTIGQWDRPPSH